MNRVNFGCGQTPTMGWLNFDNSMSVRLSAWPRPVVSALRRLGVVSSRQNEMIEACRRYGTRPGDARKRIPMPDRSLDVLYSSHMLEHLEREGARCFLVEARRVLRPGGILRLAVPDLRVFVQDYIETGDGDRFVTRTHLTKDERASLIGRLRYLVVGERHHQWLYDSHSLPKLLEEVGFKSPKVLAPGETTIPDPGNLNLREREDESLYVEAVR